jgi:hypothetical protein
MDGIELTDTIERADLSVDVLVVNEMNPNKMKKREFDLLVDNIEKTGLTDPVLVRPIEDGKYRIVGGHHRFDAAKYLGFTKVPCTIIRDPAFDDDAEKFQLVRMNAIRGKLDTQAFFKLYNSMAGKYQDDTLQELFGFADEKEFQRLINQMAKELPKEQQAKFKAAAKEVKTIDGLAKLMNEMFTKYGDTLPYGFMVIDFGGKESVWLQASKPTMKAVHEFGDVCKISKRSMDALMGALVQSIANGEAAELLDKSIAATPEVEIPENAGIPTEENIKLANQF